MKSRGRYIVHGKCREAEIVFWGEWEPESRVLTRFQTQDSAEPSFLYEPFFVRHLDGVRRQNTDPFVFGKRFYYTGCLQHTNRGPTQLRFLARGSLIVFGSYLAGRFVVDTVFVVDDFIDHSPGDWEQKLNQRVSATYREVTLEPWYNGSASEGPSSRLYLGATTGAPVDGMFSFVPCRPYVHNGYGFRRPEIELPGLITPQLQQGKKIARNVTLAETGKLWKQIARQVEDQGLLLGTYVELPRRRRERARAAAVSGSRGRC
jgi:hypothetical protein